MHGRLGPIQFVSEAIAVCGRLRLAFYAVVIEDQQRRRLRKPSTVPSQEVFDLIPFIADYAQ